jgi:hypothetical protein
MYCRRCGAQLPDDAVFCSKCGLQMAGGAGAGVPSPPPPPSSSSPTLAAVGVQELKCPTCGAPIHPTLGETVISCEYCGGSVTLGGQGWKEISKHTMLPLRVVDPTAALKVVHDYVDQGFFHRHEFEESKVVDTKLTYVPFWVLPATASTTYQYQAVATSIGTTVGTIAAAEILGNALGGRRGGGGGFIPVPIITGPVVNSNRSETISGQYEYPVIAVKAMRDYQPKEYQFSLTDRALFDKKAIPSTAPILNGDLDEDTAKGAARAFVQQLQSETVHKKHSVVSNINTQVTVSDGELLHVPIWQFSVERKDQRSTFIVDAHAGRVIRTV